MDPVSKGIKKAYSEQISTLTGVDTKTVLNCLENKCQQEMNKCKGREGPCRMHPIRMDSRRACRGIRNSLAEKAEEPCVSWCQRSFDKYYGKKSMQDEMNEKLYGKSLKAADTPLVQQLSNPEEDFAGCVRDCKNKAAENADEFQACFNMELYQKMTNCMVAKCSDKILACAKKRCDLDLKLD